jgi:hypothetical protein
MLAAVLLLGSLSAFATSITIQSLVQPNYQGGGSTATMKIFADREFVTSTNVHVFKSAIGSKVWYQTISCTVSGTTLTIPQFTIDSTTDSSVPSATYTFALYDSGGRLVDTLFKSFQVPYTLGNSITFPQLILWNQTPAIYKPGQTYSKEQTDAQITAAISTNTYTQSQSNTLLAGKLDLLALVRGSLSSQINITSNTTLADSGLSINLEAGGVYAFRVEGQVQAGAGGWKVQLGGTHTRTSLWGTGRAEDTSGTVVAAQTNVFGAPLTVAGAATDYYRYWGVIECQNAGTLTVQFAQNSSNGASTLFTKNAFIILTKLN